MGLRPYGTGPAFRSKQLRAVTRTTLRAQPNEPPMRVVSGELARSPSASPASQKVGGVRAQPDIQRHQQ
jgi:hypothetical protein